MGLALVRQNDRQRSPIEYASIQAATPPQRQDNVTGWDFGYAGTADYSGNTVSTLLSTSPLGQIVVYGAGGNMGALQTLNLTLGLVPPSAYSTRDAVSMGGVIGAGQLSGSIFSGLAQAGTNMVLSAAAPADLGWNNALVISPFRAPSLSPLNTDFDIDVEVGKLRSLMDDDQTLSEASVAAFSQFMDRFRLTRPKLFLLDDGNLSALWKAADGKQIALDFIGGTNANFAILGSRSDKVRERGAGLIRFDGFWPLVDTFRLWDVVSASI